MKNIRPVFLNLFVIRLPIAAVVSILHRVSGVLLFAASFYLLWLLSLSLESSSAFDRLQLILEEPIHSFILWLTLSTLGYHLIAGVRHLLMDLHFGDSLKAGRLAAVFVLVFSVVVSTVIGIWFWF